LTLRDAIHRGLRANLGLLLSTSASEIARGQRLQALSALMPEVNGNVSETVEQLNLRTIGLSFSTPGIPIPTIVGPFQYTDLRASASVTIFDYTKRKNYRSYKENQRAAQLSERDARDLVVQAVANAYFHVITEASRVEAIRAQVLTDQALYDRAVDRRKAGTSPGIDVLRAQVELNQQQQRLLAQRNQLEKSQLSLARVIGLPVGQDFNIADSVPYPPLTSITQQQALHIALDQRPDYQAAKAQVRAAEEALRAAHGERYLAVGVTGDYGLIGPTLTNSHGTFTAVASLKFNIFDGGRINADIIQAQATLKQRLDELADLGGQIDFQVRTAFLDLQSAADQVAVAKINFELANQTLLQARDRFSAGVTDNVEVVQAQQWVASANDNLISALSSHNLAKVALARALGAAEQGIQKFLEVK
jgi:outer membrane protein TolC